MYKKSVGVFVTQFNNKEVFRTVNIIFKFLFYITEVNKEK